MGKFKIFGSIATMLLLFIVAGGCAIFALFYNYAYSEQALRSGDVCIPSTTANISQQAEILYSQGFLADTSGYLQFARKLKKDRVYGGCFQIKKGATYRTLLATLGGGIQKPVTLTFNNIRNLERLAAVVSSQIEADSASIVAYFSDKKMAEKHGFTPQNFLSMVIPNSYQFYWNSSAERFAERMEREYKAFWNSSREAKREKLSLSRQEVSVLASIVVEESKVASEQPLIAGVYLNRLKRGMLLQADPTVKFALGDPTIKRILYAHLKVDSPYNTYRYKGLPPSIIYLPEIGAIDAVLNYKKSSYLYFCASDALDGTHRFAKTLKEHNKNSAAYSKALNKLGIR